MQKNDQIALLVKNEEYGWDMPTNLLNHFAEYCKTHLAGFGGSASWGLLGSRRKRETTDQSKSKRQVSTVAKYRA